MGVKHFCMGWDMSILHEWFTQTGGPMRELLEEKHTTGTSETHPVRASAPHVRDGST